MAGSTDNHSLIAQNTGTSIHNALKNKKKKCKVFNSDLKIFLKKVGSGVYPDISVICDKIDYYKKQKHVVTNPLLIVEVLSTGTESYDRYIKVNTILFFSF